MSRVGKMPITIPPGVTVEVKDGEVLVAGTKGTFTQAIDRRIRANVKDNQLTLTPSGHSTHVAHLHGLTRTLLANAIGGVTKGWEKTVELVGVGYRAQGGGSEVTLTIGFSHPVTFSAPKDTTFTVSDNTKITVTGIDKKVVGEIAAKLRAVKPPEPYKGKGIRYRGEIIRKKAGKAVKTVGAVAS